MSSATDTRFKTALVFSAVCLPVVITAARAFDVVLAPDEYDRALAMLVPGIGAATMAVMATWLLVAALLERRPALSDRRGRWLWAWTLIFCGVLLTIGLMSAGSQTIGAALIYASGLLTSLIGSIGLIASALPTWRSGAAGR